MNATVTKTFSLDAPVVETALPWLASASVLEKDSAPAWMKALRATGADAFSRSGMPTPAREGWQYTNTRGLSSEKFTWHAEAVKFDAAKLPPKMLADSYRVVFVNGQLQAKFSELPAYVTVTAIADTPDAQEYLAPVGDMAEHPMTALNAAYLRDGAVIRTAKGQDIDRPVEVLFYSTGGGVAAYPRVLYWLAENSGMTVMERHVGEGEYFNNIYTAIELNPASRMKYYRFVEETTAAQHFSHTLLRQSKNASFEGFSGAFSLGAGRQETRMQLIDRGISSSIGGIYLLKGQQCHDFTINAAHFEPDGTSIQHFKGVIDDTARAIFQGKIYVSRPAQKTDGYQSHHALLLSAKAEANAKPELEIYADDVKCSHGATAGYLDAEAMFYLRTRGIPQEDARALLIESFVLENLERLTSDAARALYAEKTTAWLSARKG
jgi:Fe-S cluster assembly protein SufD